ncbi:MAG: RimK-like ATPgrasp N-terminal domain-containing protein [Methanomicrobiales archaeon]|nr:RimK-like ATPgrasp N-terminal domain-containing protein [Methanomicrobiales archaeon]MDD1663644.1 RimK-like ATPgrasp N-terminal domain-containing protein [Methanomicrobiales archaeon]
MKGNAGRVLKRDLIHERMRAGLTYVISEDYSYKTEAYYRILTLEMEGKETIPSTRDILEAYVVPVCLTRAKGAGIPVCEWGISDERVPVPSILYGISYFADPSEYSLVRDPETAGPVIKYITGNGKYPFCYQPVPESAEIVPCVAIFGRTAEAPEPLAGLAAQAYRLFRVPLMEVISVYTDSYRLSSITPVRYSKLSRDEKGILEGILAGECNG